MKKLLALLCALALTGCTSVSTDYPPAIRVDDVLYFGSGQASPVEIDDSAILGEIEAYVDGIPQENGQANFSRELGNPYAKVEGGIAVLIGNEWTLFTSEADPWGVTLSVKEARENGVTLVLEQSGGSPTGELQYGTVYWLEQKTETGWEPVTPVREDIAWTMQAFVLPKGESQEHVVNWEGIYGRLGPGTYRIGKSIMDFRGPGDYDERSYYAEFVIE